MKFFVTFSGHNKQAEVISHNCRTHKGSFAQCALASDIFCIEPILHRRGLQRINLHSINIWHQLHTSLPFPQPPSSDPEETPNLLHGEISGFTSILPVFTTGLTGLSFPPETVFFFAVFLLLFTIFLANGFWDRLVSYLCR
jgi:hypothetical protein